MEFTLPELKQQSARLAELISKCSLDAEAVKLEITELARAADEAMRMELRTGDEAPRRDAEQRLADARAKLTRLVEHGRRAHQESVRVDQELMHAENVQRQARIARAKALSDAVFAKVGTDSKGRELLLKGMALLMVGHQNENIAAWNWSGVLEDVFTRPEWSELESHLEAARKALA